MKETQYIGQAVPTELLKCFNCTENAMIVRVECTEASIARSMRQLHRDRYSGPKKRDDGTLRAYPVDELLHQDFY